MVKWPTRNLKTIFAPSSFIPIEVCQPFPALDKVWGRLPRKFSPPPIIHQEEGKDPDRQIIAEGGLLSSLVLPQSTEPGGLLPREGVHVNKKPDFGCWKSKRGQMEASRKRVFTKIQEHDVHTGVPKAAQEQKLLAGQRQNFPVSKKSGCRNVKTVNVPDTEAGGSP